MKEVAKFLHLYEAVNYCDENEKKDLLIWNEWGYFVVLETNSPNQKTKEDES